jgi:hypothetical protein
MSWDIDSSAAGRSCCTRQTTLMIFAAALNMKMIRTNKFIIDNQKKPRDLEDDDGSNRYHESGSNSRQQQCADVHRSRRGVRTRKRRLGAWDQECFVANCCC